MKTNARRSSSAVSFPLEQSDPLAGFSRLTWPPTVCYVQCAELSLANIDNEPSGDQDKENDMGRKME